MNKDHTLLIQQLGALLIDKKICCTVAESCTGGLLCAEITALSGASPWFDCGFITYSNSAKHSLLGVPQHTLDTYGAVSAETVRAMAEGALLNSKAQLSVAISGLAGPDSDDSKQPVGTVYLAWSGHLIPTITHYHYLSGSRDDIRHECVDLALEGLIKYGRSILASE